MDEKGLEQIQASDMSLSDLEERFRKIKYQAIRRAYEETEVLRV